MTTNTQNRGHFTCMAFPNNMPDKQSFHECTVRNGEEGFAIDEQLISTAIHEFYYYLIGWMEN